MKQIVAPSRNEFPKWAQAALELDFPYSFRSLNSGTPSAVLMLWGFSDHSEGSEPHLLLSKRTETTGSHKGQYAFPGGVFEESDAERDGLLTTALRETYEEVGIDAENDVDVFGKLPELSTPSGFRIHPYVGTLRESIHAKEILVQASEIDFTLWVPLSTLVSSYRVERILIGDREFDTDVFHFDGHRVWGATGAMIRNFLDRLEKVAKKEG
jgi:8-oxo-dGTP pyrophosphatase MutT (NUDIX family)